MEITSTNDGLLTNIEVFDLLESRRQQRVENHPIAIELQNRERVEMQVPSPVNFCAVLLAYKRALMLIQLIQLH